MERNKMDFQADDESSQNMIVIKNNYLFKSELTTRIASLIFFGWLVSINLTTDPDSLNELYRRMALGTSVIGILWSIFGNFRISLAYIKNDIFIKEVDDLK